MRNLRNVSPADVEASKALQLADPATMAALIAGIVRHPAVSRHEHGEDVASLAACTVARHYAGVQDVAHAVNSAVRHARSDTDRAYSLAAWDVYGDMTADVNGLDPLGDTRTMLYRPETPRPDARWEATPGDYVASIGRMLPTREAEAWQEMCAAWLSHVADDCRDCHAATGRTVSPAGVVAHLMGVTAEDSAYHRAYRASRGALKAARPVLAALVAEYAPRPAGSGRDRQVLPVTPRHRAKIGPVLPGKSEEDVKTYGTRRDLTPGEAFVIRYPACKASPSHRDDETGEYAPCDCPATVRWDGEEYGVSSGPAPAGDRTQSGMVRAFKPVVSPRKRGSDNGPSVSAW